LKPCQKDADGLISNPRVTAVGDLIRPIRAVRLPRGVLSENPYAVHETTGTSRSLEIHSSSGIFASGQVLDGIMPDRGHSVAPGRAPNPNKGI